MSDPFMGATPSFVQPEQKGNVQSVIPFSFEGANFRALEIDGEPYFVGRDVAELLGYAKPENAIATHCKGTLKRGIPTPGGEQQMAVIPERDLYRLIMRSKLPAAERFEERVVGEVLPTIRKTGSYGVAAIQPPAAAPRLRSQSPGVMFRDLQRTYQSTGLPLIDAANAANRAVLSLTGIDILAAGGVVLPGAPTIPPDDVPALAAPDHPNHLTVTDIGIEIGVRTGSPMSGKAVNQALKTHGFQVKGATTTTPWMPTEKGKPYAKFGDVVTKGESGRTVNALTWKWEVISELLSAMTAGQGEG